LQGSRGTQLDRLIVRHGGGIWPCQDLLCFVHGADQKQTPISIKNIKDLMQKERIPPSALKNGWRRFAATQRGLEQVIVSQGGDAAIEVLEAQSFHILIAPRPLVEYTAAFASSPGLAVIPEGSDRMFASSHRLAVTPKSGDQMTVGLYADCHDGRQGVTTSLHAIDKFGSTHVEILHHLFPVLETDKSPITDSCFIEIPSYTKLQQHFLRPLKPLVGVAPAVGGIMSFESVHRGKQSATITAVDIGIPWFTHSPNQVKVYTDPVTVPGDSGTALIDDYTDTVVGFCFWRFVGPFSAGAWIWAESVFIAHHLIY